MSEEKTADSSRTEGQRRAAIELLRRLGPHLRRDRNLPARIAKTLAGDRRFGARDRRLYRELLYTAVRYLPWVEPVLESDPDAAIRVLAWLASGEAAAHAGALPPCPPRLADKTTELEAILNRALEPAHLLPPWIPAECPEALEPARNEALLSRAPLWLRLAGDTDCGPGRRPGLPDTALDEFDARGWAWRRSPLLPSAVQLVEFVDATAIEAYRRGSFEVQDLGSQLVLESVGIEPGGQWLDACAGAGGKALQLAGLLGPAGRVEARDIRAAPLLELRRRAARAGLSDRIVVADFVRNRNVAEVVRLREKHPNSDEFGYAQGAYDGVLLDVPCSGSGTWRRSPHLKWTTTAASLAADVRRQRKLLEAHAPLVRPGGLLVYATCSLCSGENERNVAEFLRAHPEFEPRPPARPFSGLPRGPGILFLPPDHDGDGFFVASLLRK